MLFPAQLQNSSCQATSGICTRSTAWPGAWVAGTLVWTDHPLHGYNQVPGGPASDKDGGGEHQAGHPATPLNQAVRWTTGSSPMPTGSTYSVSCQVDPHLARTVVVSTKLDTRLPQFGCGEDVEMFLRPPGRLLEPGMLSACPFFTCALLGP